VVLVVVDSLVVLSDNHSIRFECLLFLPWGIASVSRTRTASVEARLEASPSISVDSADDFGLSHAPVTPVPYLWDSIPWAAAESRRGQQPRKEGDSKVDPLSASVQAQNERVTTRLPLLDVVLGAGHDITVIVRPLLPMAGLLPRIVVRYGLTLHADSHSVGALLRRTDGGEAEEVVVAVAVVVHGTSAIIALEDPAVWIRRVQSHPFFPFFLSFFLLKSFLEWRLSLLWVDLFVLKVFCFGSKAFVFNLLLL